MEVALDLLSSPGDDWYAAVAEDQEGIVRVAHHAGQFHLQNAVEDRYNPVVVEVAIQIVHEAHDEPAAHSNEGGTK